MTAGSGTGRRSPATWPAPAKLNLFLHVLGRRADGYHELQTVFQLLDFSDQLTFSLRRDPDIRRPAGHDGLAEEDDLVVRAARLLQSEAGVEEGVEIRVDKRIPAGGGLGGGSSDAATTLLALNHLWDAGMSREALAGLGARLGADVHETLLAHGADLAEPRHVLHYVLGCADEAAARAVARSGASATSLAAPRIWSRYASQSYSGPVTPSCRDSQ